MSQNYKIIIQYEGTRYDGWQKQGNTENTIQGKLEKVLERMAGCPVEVHGSGRTDAGVHAMGQVANFHLPDGCRPDAEWIRDYLNQYLPEDIAITELIMVPERYHSRLSAVKKIYTVWAPIPEAFTSSEAFAVELVKRSGVLVTPGSAFGPAGEGHVRMALVQDEPELKQGIAAIDACGILR